MDRRVFSVAATSYWLEQRERTNDRGRKLEMKKENPQRKWSRELSQNEKWIATGLKLLQIKLVRCFASNTASAIGTEGSTGTQKQNQVVN